MKNEFRHVDTDNIESGKASMDRTNDLYYGSPRTFEDYFLKYLVTNGMFAEQADAVMAVVKEDLANLSMEHRWSEAFEGYPAVMLSVLRIGIRAAALEYIDENCPQAWFRPVFVD